MSSGFVHYKDRRILLIDFSASNDPAALIKTTEEAMTLAAANQPGSLLGLVDFSGTNLGKEKQDQIKKMAAHNRPYMRFIAIAGLTGCRAFLLRLMLLLRKRTNHKVFGSRQEALDWLARQ